MIRATVSCVLLLSSLAVWAADEKKPIYPSFDYDMARKHEIKPHRRIIPHEGVQGGLNQLGLTLTISPTGDVLSAEAGGLERVLRFWPDLREEVLHWKFIPFEKNGTPVTAEVAEYLDLVPPERLPTSHVPPPALRPDSEVSISLQRGGCYGTCPSYTVTVSTAGIEFDGAAYVTATGKHTDTTDPSAVRELAKKFLAADFYSMEDEYVAGITDFPTYILSITIDGTRKQVLDYVGYRVGMPQVISELEHAVDDFARTDRWINRGSGTKVSDRKIQNRSQH